MDALRHRLQYLLSHPEFLAYKRAWCAVAVSLRRREMLPTMNDATFRDFVLDQLQRLGEVDYRRMFGSYGLYHDEVFFGILAQGRLYFKTNAVTRVFYVQRVCCRFVPTPGRP